MRRIVVMAVFGVMFGAVSGVPHVDAAQLDVMIPADSDVIKPTFQFVRIIYIQYPDGGELAGMLQDRDHVIAFTADNSTQGMDKVVQQINQNLKDLSSSAVATSAVIEYHSTLQGNAEYAVIEYKIKLMPHITGHVLARAFETSTVDSNWRGIYVDEPVVVDTEYGLFDINTPKAALDVMVPEIAEKLDGVTTLESTMIDASKILELPLSKWHSLFDNTAIIPGAKEYNFSGGEYVITHYSMGTCGVFTGLCDKPEDGPFEKVSLDKTYLVRSIRADNDATIAFEGYVDVVTDMEGHEIFQTNLRSTLEHDTDEFPVVTIYGMAAVTAVAGVAVFVASNRKLKKDNEHQGQSGIDPAHLVSYETSNSVASYKTNRGESHLRPGTKSRMPI